MVAADTNVCLSGCLLVVTFRLLDVSYTDAYLELCQTSKMKYFAKIVNRLKAENG